MVERLPPARRRTKREIAGPGWFGILLRSTFINYDFRLIHQTMRVSPAMDAGIIGHARNLGKVVPLANQ